MKLWDIVKTVGSAALQVALPGTGSLIVGAVNELLPDDKKLPAGATGDDLNTAISSLPPEKQAAIMEKEYDVELAKIESWATIQGHLSKADAAGASTRPAIAMMMAWLVVLQVFTVCAIMAGSVAMADNAMLGTIKEFWPMLLASMGTPILLLRSYFGMRTEEKKHRVQAATGVAPIAGLITSLFKKG